MCVYVCVSRGQTRGGIRTQSVANKCVSKATLTEKAIAPSLLQLPHISTDFLLCDNGALHINITLVLLTEM